MKLPIELIENILSFLINEPYQLFNTSLVNREFSKISQQFLYSFVCLRPWEKPNKLSEFFNSIHSNKQLATLVKSLEVKSFPRNLNTEQTFSLYQLVLECLPSFIRLQSISWTRSNTLTDDILIALSKLPTLKCLEINGDHSFDFDLCFNSNEWKQLNSFKVILPNRQMTVPLKKFLIGKCNQLSTLGILGRESNFINDTDLVELANHLKNLHTLSLGGLKRVSIQGINPLLQANCNTIRNLCLESLSFSSLSSQTPFVNLPNLQSLTFTIGSQSNNEIQLNTFLQLINSAHNLSSLTIYSSGFENIPTISQDFFENISHLYNLKYLRLHHVKLPLKSFVNLSKFLTSLQELVVHLDVVDVITIANECCQHFTNNLLSMHLLGDSIDGSEITPQHLKMIVDRLSNITQIGWRSRVWVVNRYLSSESNDENDNDIYTPFKRLYALSEIPLLEKDEAFAAYKSTN